MSEAAQSFDLHGTLTAPVSPIIISVPHAGRDYPLALQAALRVPVEALAILEDRYVDQLALAARRDETMLVQQPARAWIDLNRAETERDPRIDDGVPPHSRPFESAKLRGGLGLIPRRAGHYGDFLRRRLANEEVIARIRADHRPYHDALARALLAARARFGIAVLVDLHSMPPAGDAQIVFGDRFGRTASARMIHRLEAVAEAAGFHHALNTPYSGGHILERHAAPDRGIHAIQMEWSRALYLDSRMDRPGHGLGRVATTLRLMLDALADEAGDIGSAIAAE